MKDFNDVLDEWFTYHKPFGSQTMRYQELRDLGKSVAQVINTFVPDCPEKLIAIERLREAIMWANAGIACNEVEK